MRDVLGHHVRAGRIDQVDDVPGIAGMAQHEPVGHDEACGIGDLGREPGEHKAVALALEHDQAPLDP